MQFRRRNLAHSLHRNTEGQEQRHPDKPLPLRQHNNICIFMFMFHVTLTGLLVAGRLDTCRLSNSEIQRGGRRDTGAKNTETAP